MNTRLAVTDLAYGMSAVIGLLEIVRRRRGAQRPRGRHFPPARIVAWAAAAMLDWHGWRNEAEVWGKTTRWCDYSDTVSGVQAEMAILCHPGNFRPSWFHARDYGLLLANPFGREAFGKGETSRVVVRPDESLRLRYGVLLHAGGDTGPDLEKVYAEYLAASRE